MSSVKRTGSDENHGKVCIVNCLFLNLFSLLGLSGLDSDLDYVEFSNGLKFDLDVYLFDLGEEPPIVNHSISPGI